MKEKTIEKPHDIRSIEAMTEEQAAALAESVETIKGHTVYFIDFGGYFGYSAVVFCDGQHIKYANDYQLHHSNKAREDLHNLYCDTLSSKLFTVDELRSPSANYEEYKAKEYFLRNYFGMRRPYISMFFAGSDAEREKISKQTEQMIFSPVFFAYYDKRFSDFVELGSDLMAGLEKAKQEAENGFEYFKSAVLREMFNHEYGINWQADYDVCSCFGNCSGVRDYEDINELFSACGFDDTKKRAYMAARKEYFSTCGDL